MSLFPDDAEDVRTLLRYADSAPYRAKAEGHNTLKFYQTELSTRMKLSGGVHPVGGRNRPVNIDRRMGAV